MKRSFIVLAMAVIISVAFSSCATSHKGCKATQGYIGYGK